MRSTQIHINFTTIVNVFIGTGKAQVLANQSEFETNYEHAVDSRVE